MGSLSNHKINEININTNCLREQRAGGGGGGGPLVFFGWVCAARDSKLAPRSKKNSPKTDTPF